MVNLDDYLGGEDEGEEDEVDTTADFAALKDALKALADAVASTNLAVINAAQGDGAAATQRVQASVAALTRFHQAFTILDAAGGEGAADEADA